MTCARIVLTGLMLLLINSACLYASSQDIGPQALSLHSAIECALSGNPDLSALKFDRSIAKSRTFQASRLPNPELSVEVENFGGSGELRESDAAETTVMISQLPSWNKLSATRVCGR